MGAAVQNQSGRRSLIPPIVYFSGYAFILIGLACLLNRLFDMELAYKGHVLPTDSKIILLSIFGGVFVALWGHFLDTQAYQDLVARHRWIPWVAWTVVVFVSLGAIVLVFLL